MKYTPEVLAFLMGTIKNMFLIGATAWTTVCLYELSHSWHSLWALLMLLFVSSMQITRD